jgi:WS/DGAT/MGAT family acyltransferase
MAAEQGDADDRAMSGAEALMWNIERDPWMAPSGGSLTLFDRPLDEDRFRRLMRHAVVNIPRLHQRVVDPLTPLGTPRWEADREMDFDWHLRRARAPGDGSLRDLLDWFTPWLQDPYDRTRPLWQYVMIDGVEGGRGALAVKLHHVMTDGKGAVRLAGAYTAATREERDPHEEVDLEGMLAALPDERSGARGEVRDALSSALRLTGSASRFLTDTTVALPDRIAGARRQLEDLTRTAGDTLHGAGSPLWGTRSRRRHLEALTMPFDDAHRAAKVLGGSVNDFFVAGAVEGAARYHDALGAPLERLHISFVVSTRGTSTSPTNAFTPVPVEVPAGPMTLEERFASLRDAMRARREDVHGGGALSSVAAVANLLPTSVVTGIARSQAAHIDFATSNLPGFLGDSYVAGARTEHTYIFGPVAGTAFNLTAFSTAGSLDLGIQLDPAAVTEPARLRDAMEGAYADLIRVGVRKPAPRSRKRTSG